LDEIEFKTIVESTQAHLLNYAFLLCRDRQLAEDLVQEAYCRLWKHRRAEIWAPGAYLRTTLSRDLMDRWRRRPWREISVASLPDSAASSSTTDEVDALVVLQVCIARLRPTQRIAVALRLLEDAATEDIATALRCAPAAARARLAEGLSCLRRMPELNDWWKTSDLDEEAGV
jgi:RNA polymerase sigma factor (sigma-70 family)